MSRTLYVLVLSGLLVAVSAVGEPVVAQSKPQSISILTGNTGGSWYPIGAGLAKVLTDAGVRTNSEQGAGNANIVSISNGGGTVGFSQAVAPPEAAQGKPPFPKKITNLKGLASLFTNYAHVVVTLKSGVQTPADLKGKPFASQPPAATAVQIFGAILSANGLSEKDLKIVVRGGPAFGAAAVKDRRAIGFHTPSGVPNGAVADAAASVPMKLLEVSDEAFRKIKQINPGYQRAVIPGGTYKGIDKDTRTVSSDTILIVNQNLPDDHAYWIVKAIATNLDAVHKIHNAVRNRTPKQLATISGVDVHPGAARYYREAGLLK